MELGDNMDFCTGRLPKDELYCSSLPQLSNYPLPDPVSAWSCTDLVAEALGEMSISNLYPIDGNDVMGNCIIEGTLVQGSRVNSGYKSKYSGPMISLTTASGKRLTVTPNHAVLIPRGFVKARFLSKGDDLVCTRRLDCSKSTGDFDFNKPPTKIEEIIASLEGTRSIFVMPNSIDFHGDERCIDGDVEIISAHGFLDRNRKPFLGKVECDQQIISATMAERFLHCSSARFKTKDIRWSPTFSGIRRRRAGLPLIIGESRLSQKTSVGHCANGNSIGGDGLEQLLIRNSIFLGQPSGRLSSSISVDGGLPFTATRSVPFGGVNTQLCVGRPQCYASFSKPITDILAIDSELPSQLLQRFSGLVFIDKIVDTVIQKIDGHVYDLSTESNWYAANGIVVHNCTCAGAAHLLTLQNGLTGSRIVPRSADVVSLYRQLGRGGDNGLPLTTVLQAWMSGILGGQKIVANCNVDANNLKSVKQAIQYLGGAYIGFATTSQTIPQFQAKQPWTVTNAREEGGHCVVLTGFDDATKMFDVLTWGGLQKATYAWFEKYCDEVHAVLSDSVAVFDSDTVANIQQAMPSLT